MKPHGCTAGGYPGYRQLFNLRQLLGLELSCLLIATLPLGRRRWFGKFGGCYRNSSELMVTRLRTPLERIGRGRSQPSETGLAERLEGFDQALGHSAE